MHKFTNDIYLLHEAEQLQTLIVANWAKDFFNNIRLCIIRKLYISMLDSFWNVVRREFRQWKIRMRNELRRVHFRNRCYHRSSHHNISKLPSPEMIHVIQYGITLTYEKVLSQKCEQVVKIIADHCSGPRCALAALHDSKAQGGCP